MYIVWVIIFLGLITTLNMLRVVHSECTGNSQISLGDSSRLGVRNSRFRTFYFMFYLRVWYTVRVRQNVSIPKGDSYLHCNVFTLDSHSMTVYAWCTSYKRLVYYILISKIIVAAFNSYDVHIIIIIIIPTVTRRVFIDNGLLGFVIDQTVNNV